MKGEEIFDGDFVEFFNCLRFALTSTVFRFVCVCVCGVFMASVVITLRNLVCLPLCGYQQACCTDGDGDGVVMG